MSRMKLLITLCCLLFPRIGLGTAMAQSANNEKPPKPAVAKRSAQRGAEPDSTNFRLNIRGTVYENQTLQPMEGAAVKLYNGSDSMLVGNITQKNGQYLLPGVPSGRYTMKVSFMGYKEQSFALTLPRKTGNFKVNDVLLRENTTLMAEAVVEGVMPEMTVVDDTVVYNADAFKLPEGSLVEDLVKKLPGIEVDESGNYTWNGKSISQIMVDGKEFFSRNMNLTLKNLPADIVEKVKAYDRQSDRARITGIDDGEERTVLDLTIKKNRKRGWFGNINGGFGTSDRYAASTNVNRFVGDQKFSIIGNANNTNGNGMTDHQSGGATMNYEKREGKREILELNGSVDGTFNQGRSESSSNSQSFENKNAAYTNRHSWSDNNNKSLNLGYRVEWKPDTMTNVNFRPSFTYSFTGSHSHTESAAFNDDPYALPFIADPLAQVDLLSDSIGVNHRMNANQNDGHNYNASASLSLNRRLQKKGRNINFNLDGGFGNRTTESENFSRTDYYQILATDGGDSVYHKAQYNDTDNRNYNLGARVSYSEPVGDRIYLQMTYGYNYRFTDNSRTVSSIFDPLNGQLGIDWFNYPSFQPYSQPDTAQCNYTTNKYQNHTVNLQLRINRTQYQLTVGGNLHPQRNEVNYTKGFKHYDVSRSVVNASPNVNFRYRFSRQERLDFRYNGSMGQPGITDLIPDTLSNADPLNIRLGNPGLKPSFTQNLSASYHKNITDLQRSYTSNASFNTTQNAVSSRTEYNELTGGRVTRPENINGNWNASGAFNFNTAFRRNMHFHVNTNTRAGLTNSVGYVYQSRAQETVKNRTRGLRLNQGLRFSYRNDWLEVSLNGNVSYNHSRSTNTSASNLDTYSFNYGMHTVINAPWGLSVGTDISEHSRRGYTDASMNTNELIWNFNVSQRLLTKRNLILSLRAVDLLNQRDEVNRNVSATARTDSRTQNIHSYFLVSATYRFGKFGGKGKRSQNGEGNERGGEGRGPERSGEHGGQGSERPAGGPGGSFGGPGSRGPGGGPF